MRLVEQFAGNLAAMLEGRQAEPAAAGASAPAGEPARPGAAEQAEEGAAAEEEPSRERPSPSPEPEALSATDLLGTVFAGRMQDPRSAGRGSPWSPCSPSCSAAAAPGADPAGQKRQRTRLLARVAT